MFLVDIVVVLRCNIMQYWSHDVHASATLPRIQENLPKD